ncbi:ribose-phosphate diphosphokinase [Desulfurococcus mucosus]|uniref:ribose-phosphate diphosphokinase n=1 Tax=Desulfurococcus mucosus (strain ATCC 35584 / DSM 2162 / JCM 9187 / O7/1) TaxID=765177 RepID=E8R8S2_DESM0|nr:ribose-phosphate diphosphokinase [Desulfurococcus mucosus]ADV64898.1 ribose-phosphate pyrophosphokinase [Desulfurococcus mucosus DSM 2162]
MVKAIVAGNYGEGYRLAGEIGAETLGVVEKVFPDGEQYVRISEPEKAKGSKVVVVSTMYPMQDQAFIKLLMLGDALARSQAAMYLAVIPYLAYSRQDKVFMPGEPVSALIVVNTLKAAGFRKLVVVDFHSSSLLSQLNDYIVNVMVSDLLVKTLMSDAERPVILAPDKGALERARFAANSIGVDYDYLVKSRDRVTGEVSYTPRELRVAGRDVIIVDDIVSTGGTIAEASRMLMKQGARRIHVATSHGLLVGNALTRMLDAGVRRIALANTLGVRVDHPLVEYVDVVPRLATVVKEILGSEP